MELHKLFLKEALGLLDKGEISSFELAKAYLSRIGKYDKKLHSFITVRDRVLVDAKKSR